ncbi:MAG: phenylalanine--tRNA ligase subunit beta, partial [Erysipelotrichaceae bacterium]
MKVSKKWLNQYVDIADISAQTLADRLTLAGLEVESINYLAFGSNLVVGCVEACDKHPNADHLSVTQVNVGSHTLQIVCGAPNIAKGQKVIVALSGAVLPMITIEKAMIKGIESNGMICSLLELGVEPKYLSEDQKNGIEVLPDFAKVGEDPLSVLGLDDVIIDIKQTPNRSDCNALWSVAYEVGALFKREVKLPVSVAHDELKPSIKIESKTEACPLILGKKIGQLSVTQSPLWLKQALNAVGIKSINNVVDISNYVMIETGQPLHFYDGHKLSKPEIIVMDHCKGYVTTLDESKIELNLEDIVITSNQINIGLAGIMGGDDSKIDESTKSIIIEAALFNPARIRHTSRRVNLITEASLRFQKGLNPLGAKQAIMRATQLLIELANAFEVEETVTYGKTDETLKQVSVTHNHIETLLGTSVDLDSIMDIFKRLGFEPQVKDKQIISTIPSYRLDITVSEDLIEEVGRFIGYTDLVGTLPVMASTLGGYDDRQILRQRIKANLVGAGLHEIVSYTLVSQEKTEIGFEPLANPLRLISPISDERA